MSFYKKDHLSEKKFNFINYIYTCLRLMIVIIEYTIFEQILNKLNSCQHSLNKIKISLNSYSF